MIKNNKLIAISIILIFILILIPILTYSSTPELDGVYHAYYSDEVIVLKIRNGKYTYNDPARFKVNMKGNLTQDSNNENYYWLTDEVGGYYIYVLGDGVLRSASSIAISDVLTFSRQK